MRTAILVLTKTDASMETSLPMQPTEARAKFISLCDASGAGKYVNAEMWTSSQGRVKRRKFIKKARAAKVTPKAETTAAEKPKRQQITKSKKGTLNGKL